MKEDLEYVWVYGQPYDADEPAFNAKQSVIVQSSYDAPFEVSWNPAQKFFNVAAKNNTTGDVTLMDPTKFEGLKNNTSGSYPNPALALTPDSKGFYFSAENSGDANTVYPLKPNFNVTSAPRDVTVKTLYLKINAMKPDYTLTGNTSLAWGSNEGTYTFSLSAPGVVLGSTSAAFYTAEIKPATEFVTVEGTTLPDGNYTEGAAKVTSVLFTEETTDFSAAELTVSDLPCSGLYNLMVRYNDSTRPYIDSSYEAALPFEIYPSSEGIELGLVNSAGTVYYVKPVDDGVWKGLKELTDATADNSTYLKVALLSTTTAGITGYYKAGSAVAQETPAKVAAAPEGYTFTDAAEQQYMNLFDADSVSIYPVKNGAIAPTPIDIRLEKTEVMTGIDTVETDADSAEYYNLQGIRVAAPQAGQIYIMRRGGKAVKVLVAPAH